MASLFYARHYPAGREVNPSDQPVPNDTPVSDANVPSPASVNDSSSSPQPTQTDYFIPSSALNNPQPTTTHTPGTYTTPASSLTTVSTPNLPVSSIISLSTGTLQPTPTAVLTQGEASSKGSSSNKKYIIGGAVGGGVMVLILLVLLLVCCRKRRAKKDIERSGGGHSEGEPGYGQFACCNHGICNKNGQPQMEQKTPLKPFILKSDSAAPIPREGQQQHTIPLNRRDSTESHKSAGSDTSSSYSSDSEGSQRGRRRSQKRPPPLKLTSLVTPVINGPQNNPRHRADRSSLQNPHEVPTIIVEPPQSATQTG